MTTLLTEGVKCRSDEEHTANDRAYEQGRVIAWEIWFDAYANGQLTLEVLLRNAQRSLLKLAVDDFQRWKALGLLAESALKLDPPRRSRGNKGQPEALRLIASRLVKMAHSEGYILNRASYDRSAFEYVAEILANLGIPVSPRQIEDWYYE